MLASVQQRCVYYRSGLNSMPLLPARGVKRAPVHVTKAASIQAPPSDETSSSEQQQEDENKPFPYYLPMEPVQQTLSSIPLLLFYPAVLACVGGAGFAGLNVGRTLPVDPDAKDVASYGVAALLGAGATFAGFQAKKKRDGAAIVDLYNKIVDLPDPSELTDATVAAVGSKYGINLQRDQLDGLQKIYGQFLESVIPAGETQLKGDEAQRVIALKDALGLSDEDAAPAHMDVGRRLYRQGFETKDRQQQFEQRKAFQRLVYVSQLVFGDLKSAFLLPWMRLFNLTDAQLFVARRDNAKAIFKAQFEKELGGDLKADRHFLRELRDRQVAVKMLDESAEEVVKDYARRNVEGHLTRGLDAIKATGKNKDLSLLVREVGAALDYCRKLTQYSNEEDMMPGLGVVTITGGPLAAEGKGRELKDLYRIYLEEKMESLGEFSEALDNEAKELQSILVISSRDAQTLRDEVAAKLYKRLLREEVVSKRIDAASSPAAVLQSLCEKVRFSPEAALELHKQLFRSKVSTLMDKGKLDQADQEDLKRIKRILCIPSEVSKKVMKETVGEVLGELMSDIFMAGAKPVPDIEMDRIDQVMQDLAIDSEVAVEVLAQNARERFKSYVTQAQKDKGDRRESAASIKKLVQFNALVVTPLLDRVKGVDAAKKELAELLMKASEEAKKEGATEEEAAAVVEKIREGTVKEVQKAMQASRGEFIDEERQGQKELTMREDTDDKTRAEVYKNYMMYTMMGDVVELPVGGMIRKKNNPSSRQADMSRLQQLADLLGMSQMEVVSAQQDLAEQAYKGQASELMRSGPMNQEKSQYLEELRTQFGISKENADKVIKAARSEVYGTSATVEEGGRWTLDRILEVTNKGGSIDGLVEEATRRNIFRKELEKRVTDGSGDLDADFLIEKLPKILSLDERKVAMVVKEIVSSRKRMLLVQAVSQLRQKRPAESVVSLQNLLSCNRALPGKEAMQWSERAELKDIFQLFCSEETGAAKRTQLQSILGLTDAEVSDIQASSAAADAAAEASGKKKGDEDNFF